MFKYTSKRISSMGDSEDLNLNIRFEKEFAPTLKRWKQEQYKKFGQGFLKQAVREIIEKEVAKLD